MLSPIAVSGQVKRQLGVRSSLEADLTEEALRMVAASALAPAEDEKALRSGREVSFEGQTRALVPT